MRPILSDVIDDTGAVLRTLRRSPGFVVVAVIVLALGCAVTGAVFSTVNGWLDVASAVPHAERLVVVAPTDHGAANPTAYFKETSYDRLFDLKLHTIKDLFVTRPVQGILATDHGSVSIRMEAVTGSYFRAVGVATLLGRPLEPGDDRAGSAPAVVIGEAAWRRLFDADPFVIGRVIQISGLPCAIVGVMPAIVRGFSIPTSTSGTWCRPRCPPSAPSSTCVDTFNVVSTLACPMSCATSLPAPLCRGTTTSLMQLCWMHAPTDIL